MHTGSKHSAIMLCDLEKDYTDGCASILRKCNKFMKV